MMTLGHGILSDCCLLLMQLCEVHSSSLRPVPDSEPAGFRMLPAVAIVFGWSDLRYVHPFRARVFVYAVLVFPSRYNS